MNRLMNDEMRTKPSIRGMPPRPEAFSPSAPFTATMSPRFVQLKYATNWAAKKTRTM